MDKLKQMTPVTFTGSARARGLLPFKRIENMLYDNSALVTPDTNNQYPVIADYKSLAGNSCDGKSRPSTKSSLWRDVQNGITPPPRHDAGSVPPMLSLNRSRDEPLSGDVVLKEEVIDLTEEHSKSVKLGKDLFC